MSVKMKFGSKDIPFVYKGDKLVYPNPIKDGLLLWYDFKGMRNTDTNKEVAKDLSGNGNDGTLTNFNFTEESGYKDNALVFDGVDDSLTIPELELDETAMSVMYDGTIYSYEDDKVMSVGEDGEIVGSGKNLLPSFYDSAWDKRQNDFVISSYHLKSAKGVRHAIVATIVLDVKPNTDYTIFMNTDLGRTRISSDSGSGDIMGYQNGDFSRVFNTGTSESIEVELGVFSGNVGEEINFSNAMLCQGRLTQHSFTPTPEDFQTTSLSPLSLSNLQLYNRPLLKDELLHNAESKGLKELVDGVVVQDGLVLHYDFSHESNNSEYKDKAFDYSGNGNHGELQNFNFTEESGYDGDKLLFDGVDDRIETIPMSNFNGALTLTTTLDIRDLSDNYVGYAMTTSDSANGARFWLSKNGQTIRIQIYDNIESRFISTAINTGKQSITITFDGSLLVMYKNGLAVSQYESETLFTKWTTNNLFIGSYDNGGTYVPPKINQKSFMMYDKALTPEEIAHNYTVEKEKFNIE